MKFIQTTKGVWLAFCNLLSVVILLTHVKTRNYKIDIYDSRDLNEIPLNRIIETRATIIVEEWEQREGVKLEDGLYRGLMRRGAGDEFAAGCVVSDVP